MARDPVELEQEVAALCAELPYINASDLTAITRGMGYKPNFNKKYIEVLRTGQTTAIHSSLVVWFYDTFTSALKRVSATLRFIDENTDDLILVRTANDIRRARAEGKIGIIIHFHNSIALEDDLSMVATYERLGLRVMQLTYQGRSLVGDGCAEPSPGGVSSFGIRVIEEMNRVGILVDLAHSGPKTFMEALEIAKVPPINSHGGMKAVRDHPRNLTDEQVIKLAEKGGVLGIMAKSDTVVEGGAVKGATLDDYFAHLDYAVKLVGPDHVCIGLENGHGVDDADLRGLQADVMTRMDRPLERGRVPEKYDFEKFYSAKGVENAATAKANLIRAMLQRGYAKADIAKILAGNLMRIYDQTWKP
jgi:membrane dipeptidase